MMYLTADLLKAHPQDFRIVCDVLMDRVSDCRLPVKTAKLFIRSLTTERVLELYRLDIKSFRTEMKAIMEAGVK